jgi:hypothetical protein
LAQESQLAHRVISNTAIPYITLTSPTSTDPHFTTGSFDILTSIGGFAERRPGFANFVEQTPTTFNNLQRLFTWDRFDGTFIVMACDINASGFAVVYKLQVGTDNSFVSLFTEPTATNTPYDFVVSNNTVYFSNGFYVRKWDPINGLSNWGIGTYSAATSNNEYCGTGADGGTVISGSHTWTNPTNIQGAPDSAYATALVTKVAGSSTNQLPTNYLNCTNYGFGGIPIQTANTIQGVQVNVTGHVTVNSGFPISPGIVAYLIVAGVRAGSARVSFLSSTTDITIPFGGSSDLWGTTNLSPALINASNFGVQLVCYGDASNVLPPAGSAWNVTFSLDSAQIVVFSSGGPVVSTSGAGSMDSFVGYQYVVCYCNSNTGHVGSPSPPSNLIGPFGDQISASTLAGAGHGYVVNDTGIVEAGNKDATYIINTVGGGGQVLTYTITAGGSDYAKQNAVPTTTAGAQPGVGAGFLINITATTGIDHIVIPVVASTDPQVNQIRIFRTTDSATGLGGQAYFEIPNSPVPNANANINDSAADANLNALSIAPIPTFNDPPTPMRGMVYYSGRIWGFTGNKVWFTGLEEITIGVPEESMPSGIAGNFWSFDQPLQALAVTGIGANQALGVLSGGRIYVVQGNTLDTFVRYAVSTRRGCRNLTCISQLGGVVAWLDSAQQVWASDGTNLNELSTLIRNDLAGINPATSSVTFHTAGRFHWLILSTGTKLYVYDVDQDQWMPPWTFAAKYIYSGEISPGNYVLMASNGTKALQLSTSAFNDNGLSYAPIMKLGLLSVVPDYGSRFSYIGVGSYNEPTRTGYPATFQVTNNAQPITDVLICSDEAPAVAIYTSIAANLVDTSTAFNRRNGTFMTQKVYQTITPASRWIGIQINLANADQVDNIYEIFMAYKSLGGR